MSRLPVPASPRELLLALGEMPAEFTLDAFLDRFDFAGVAPHQVIYSALGRLPDSAQAAHALPGYDARRHLGELLLGTEFQGRMIVQTLHAFPEKKRAFFVHVPKCAGTDLMTHLQVRHSGLCLEQYMMSPHYLPPLKMLWQLRAIVSKRSEADSIAVMGHIRLATMMAKEVIRFGDPVFSVIREPVDMALSVVNYGLTMMAMAPQKRPMVLRRFADLIGLKPDRHGVPDRAEECKALARRWLHDPQVLPHNLLCHYLGQGTFDSALELTARANVELTTVTRYDAWLQTRWGVARSARANESGKYLARADLGENDLAYLNDITREDARFYQLVDTRLAASGSNSLFAPQLL